MLAGGQELIAKQAVEAGGGTPADAAAFVKLELGKWDALADRPASRL